MTSRSLFFDERSTWLVTVTGNGELAVPAVRAEQAQEEEQRLLDRDLVALLVDEVEPFRRPVEDDAEVRPDRGHEPLRLADQSESDESPLPA